ncbi:hypothetical protein MCY_01175, partial [Bartonella rattimassiliensis 15908]
MKCLKEGAPRRARALFTQLYLYPDQHH